MARSWKAEKSVGKRFHASLCVKSVPDILYAFRQLATHYSPLSPGGSATQRGLVVSVTLPDRNRL